MQDFGERGEPFVLGQRTLCIRRMPLRAIALRQADSATPDLDSRQCPFVITRRSWRGGLTEGVADIRHEDIKNFR